MYPTWINLYFSDLKSLKLKGILSHSNNLIAVRSRSAGAGELVDCNVQGRSWRISCTYEDWQTSLCCGTGLWVCSGGKVICYTACYTACPDKNIMNDKFLQPDGPSKTMKPIFIQFQIILSNFSRLLPFLAFSASYCPGCNGLVLEIRISFHLRAQGLFFHYIHYRKLNTFEHSNQMWPFPNIKKALFFFLFLHKIFWRFFVSRKVPCLIK